ncbi:hypothetical protein CRYUN_Cryun06bG0124200 [Craigia yunnanensis]
MTGNVTGTSQRWKPPENDFFKINFDGALNSRNNGGRIGVIIRNGGDVMGAKASSILRAKDSFRSECYGVCNGSCPGYGVYKG